MFDKKTRTAIKVNTNNFGNGLAGARARAEQDDRRTAPAGEQRDPGAANLASPQTDFRGFFKGLAARR